MSLARVALAACLVGALPCVSSRASADARASDYLATLEDPARIYEAACAACHAPDGTGNPAMLVGFDVPLPDFTDCSFASREPAADWYAVAHEGGPVRGFDRMMPSFRDALTSEQIEKAVAHVMTQLRKNEKGLRMGMKLTDAPRAARGAAVQGGEYVIPLRATPYAPGGGWKGTVRFFLDEDDPGGVLDHVHVALLCDPYDKDILAKAVIATGHKLGLNLENDDEEPDYYLDATSRGRDVSVAFGEGIISIVGELYEE